MVLPLATSVKAPFEFSEQHWLFGSIRHGPYEGFPKAPEESDARIFKSNESGQSPDLIARKVFYQRLICFMQSREGDGK